MEKIILLLITSVRKVGIYIDRDMPTGEVDFVAADAAGVPGHLPGTSPTRDSKLFRKRNDSSRAGCIARIGSELHV
jgi:hypothetical protein